MIKLTKSKMNQFDYLKWTEYFKKNDTQRLDISFSDEHKLSDEEKNLIFPSILAFQKGEGSDGIHLMSTVDDFINAGGDPAYKEAMLWFVREENWHSYYLKKYMDLYQIAPLKKSFLDKLFRKLRQAGGLKCEVTILVTAEMIALTYYDALANSTKSPVLKRICGQMLHDELPHIMFQSYTLRHFEKRPLDKLTRIMVMETTLLFVWGAFHNVYQAGGYNFFRFLKENLGYLHQSIQLVERKGS